MTFYKSALISTAIATATSTSAFAGDDWDKKKKADMEDRETITKTMKKSDYNKTKMHSSKINDTVGEVLQADGQPSIQSDRQYLTHDGDMKTHAMNPSVHAKMGNKSIVVPSTAGAVTTLNCPEGTTAQPDMTCMMTGDYDVATSTTTYNIRTDVAGAVDYDRRENYIPSYNGEYKGTLRPESLVTENVNRDYNGQMDMNSDYDRDSDSDNNWDNDREED